MDTLPDDDKAVKGQCQEPAEGTASQSDAPQAMHISPFYHSAVNEITEPNTYAAHSHYLTRRWKRELGPTAYAVLTSLRDRCFYNRKTGEVRNSIQVTIAEIAEECGVSDRTVRRELETNLALKKFVRAQREYAPDARRGGFRYGASSFQVSMDDPLHPLDEPALIEIVQRKAEEAEKAAEHPLERARRAATSGQIDRTLKSRGSEPEKNPATFGQFVQQTGQIVTTSGQFVQHHGQIDRTIRNHDSSLLKKTLPDAARPGDSLTLFPEQTAPAWAQLTDAEQQPYREQAEKELIGIVGLSGWQRMRDRGRSRQVGVRAQGLFLAEQKRLRDKS